MYIKNSALQLMFINIYSWQVVQYNVIGGKMNRGMAVSLSLKEILPKDQLNEDIMRKCHILGWCIELVRHFF